MSETYLAPGLPIPAPARDGLDAPYWQGLTEECLLLQRCTSCGHWQWGPECICHHCLSFDLSFAATEPEGRVYSYERVWHPVHPALTSQGPLSGGAGRTGPPAAGERRNRVNAATW